MRTLMQGDAWVHYSQIYVESGNRDAGLSESFGGQRNGLCGAAEPGALSLITGLHTGSVAFAVELHDVPPPVDESWEEVVEVSFRPEGDAVLAGWGGEHHWELDLAEIDYRVRYCASRMDEGRAADVRMEDEPEIDRYLLQFWPAPPEPDRIIKQTSEIAAYWHDHAQRQPPPPTPEEKAETERVAREEQERAAAEARLAAETRKWGGTLPSDRLRRLRGNAMNVCRFDRPFVEALAEQDPATQWEITRWVIRRAYTEAQLTEIDWIVPALAAVDRGEPLPPPFDDDRLVWDRLLADPDVPHTLVTDPDGRHDNCLQQAMALPAIFAVLAEDPLHGVLDALWSAAVAFGRGNHSVLFAELRAAFPAVQ
jgi:hypothetical protein